MAMQLIEGVFTIALLAMVLTHWQGFSDMLAGFTRAYAGTVTGLQGRTGGY